MEVEVQVKVEFVEMRKCENVKICHCQPGVKVPSNFKGKMLGDDSWPNFSRNLQNLISHTMVVLPGPETPGKWV